MPYIYFSGSCGVSPGTGKAEELLKVKGSRAENTII